MSLKIETYLLSWLPGEVCPTSLPASSHFIRFEGQSLWQEGGPVWCRGGREARIKVGASTTHMQTNFSLPCDASCERMDGGWMSMFITPHVQKQNIFLLQVSFQITTPLKSLKSTEIRRNQWARGLKKGWSCFWSAITIMIHLWLELMGIATQDLEDHMPSTVYEIISLDGYGCQQVPNDAKAHLPLK